MAFKKRYIVASVCVVAAVGAGVLFLAACEEDVPNITPPQVQYNDQTFSLLVCDGNNNTAWSWGHDGAAVCTLDWNNDGAGPNRVPVNYVYDVYPIVDGLVTKTTATEQGDDLVWGQVPWTTIKTSPIYAGGSGITEVKVKALYTYVNPPRIWFLFQWEDPSHTIAADDVNIPKGAMEYYWLQAPGFSMPGDGFKDNKQLDSKEDWLALVWSTWFLWNTNDKGKADKNAHSPADPNGYNWRLVETVPGFQQKGVDACKGSGDTVYKTPVVSSSDPNSPYYDKYFPGAFCDMWFFSASRSNFCSLGAWETDEPASMIDAKIDSNGFNKPAVPSYDDKDSWNDFLEGDSGVSGNTPNFPAGTTHYPGYQAVNDPQENPPGALYLWSSSEMTHDFDLPGPWGPKDARIAGYLHRPALGSAGDISCRGSWEDPSMWRGEANGGYDPYSYWGGDRPTPNEIAKDWNYTLEVEREIGSITKTDATEDTLLGLFDAHPGE